jgi:hypothetical protein
MDLRQKRSLSGEVARPEVLRRACGSRSDLKPPQLRGNSCVPLREVGRRNCPSPPTPLSLAILSLQGTSPRRRGGEGSRYGLAAGKWRPAPERLPVWGSAIRMEVRLLLCWGWCNRTLRRRFRTPVGGPPGVPPRRYHRARPISLCVHLYKK